jgi:uncharacterized membrane protein (DUF485 family)
MEENNEMNNENEINEKKINNINNQQDIINERYEELVKKIKIQTIIFYIIILLLSGFFYIYLVSFFAIYTGTKGKVLKAYYISIIEFECKISLSSRNNRLMIGKKRLKIGKSKYLFDFSSFLHTFLLSLT